MKNNVDKETELKIGKQLDAIDHISYQISFLADAIASINNNDFGFTPDGKEGLYFFLARLSEDVKASSDNISAALDGQEA